MENEPRRSIETLFHAATTRAAGAERRAYLDGACGDDADLRARVEALLAAHDEAQGFLESPAVVSPQEGPGSVIGPYKLLQQIGEGGMGVVYMAEQQHPVRRKVALKIIKLGMDTVQVIARFEAERQALALMDHAHIARVLDAGATENGRPYFVMELVRGVPIHEYCDTHKLATAERRALFVDVCRAVQHAHQKGVIHRDLKPTNVLVTSHDGKPVPKVIDFGVAKATNQRLTERTLFTEFHQIIGTPEYMSPEQAEMSGLDVDTRSDIYALGVLLYQLLTGTTPVDPTDLRTAGFEEMTRMIREDEPPSPSTRISKLGADGEKIARSRGSDAGALSRNLRGDLDWIVLKALEKDRTRRYETASAFAEDVERHLADLPVEAGPPGARYRLAKFAHRNRKAVTAAAVLVIVVGLGLAGTTAGFLRARAEAERSGKISASLQDVLAMTDPGRAANRGEVEQVLADVRAMFGEEDATFAAVLDTLSQRLRDAGDFETAADLCRESLGVWKRVYGEDHPNVAITMARLGAVLRAQGEDEQAESALREAIATLDQASDTPGLAAYDARFRLADLLGNRGEYAEAEELLGEALAILRASRAPEHFRILETLEARAVVQMNAGFEGLRETVREAYDETHAFYPDDSPMLAVAALGYGRALYHEGDHDAAEPFLREAVERLRACKRPRGVYFLLAADLLFQVVRGRNDAASVLETDELLRDLVAVARDIWGAEQLADTQAYYASRMVDRGRLGDALDAMRDAHRALAEAGRPVEDRKRYRYGLVKLASKVLLRPDLAPEVYAKARSAVELALTEEPDHPPMTAILGGLACRSGEHARALEILDRLGEPLPPVPEDLASLVHAFRALARAHLGEVELAREELERLRAAFRDAPEDDEGRALLREVEERVEPGRPAGER